MNKLNSLLVHLENVAIPAIKTRTSLENSTPFSQSHNYKRHMIHHLKSHIKLTLTVASLCGQLVFGAEPPVTASTPALVTISINPADRGRVFEGVGAVSAGATSVLVRDYPEALRNDIMDLMFKPKHGASFQHLKIELGSGVNSTCGAEPSHAVNATENLNPVDRGYELWLANEAKKRNPNLLLDVLPWGTPDWTTDFFSPEAGDWAISFLKLARQKYGLEFNYIGGCQNEHSDVANKTNSELNRNFVVNILRPALNSNGFKAVGIITSDFCNLHLGKEFLWSVNKDVLADKDYFNAVAAIGYHYPVGYMTGSRGTFDHRPLPAGFIESGKPMWASEDYSNLGGAVDIGIDYIAKVIREYDELRITKSVAWAPFSSLPKGLPYYNVGFLHCPSPYSGNYNIFPSMWCIAHLTQFVQPGWTFADAATGRFDSDSVKGMYATFHSPDALAWSFVAVTDQPRAVELNFGKDYPRNEIAVWKTNAAAQFVLEKTVKPMNGLVRLELDGQSLYSVTNTTGQLKGTPSQAIPKAKDMDSWSDDLTAYAPHSIPKFWMDQEGTFEVVPQDGRNVFKQIMPNRGYIWRKGSRYLNEAYTCFGGRSAGPDYSLQAAAKITNGYVQIGASRLDPIIRLRVYQNGDYQVLHQVSAIKNNQSPEAKELAAGKLPNFAGDDWNQLSVRVNKGTEVFFSVNGVEVFRGKVACGNTFPSLGSSYHANSFRDFFVNYAAPKAP